MKFATLRWLKNFGADDGADALASLIGAAQANPEFRQELLNLLKLPAQHREPLILTAVAEMRLKREPESACRAFEALESDEAAARAIGLLEG